MSINRSEAILLFAILSCSVAVPFAVCLSLFVSPEVMNSILLVLLLSVGVTNAVFIGRSIARWRAKRARVPDGPEADYVDPAA